MSLDVLQHCQDPMPLPNETGGMRQPPTDPAPTQLCSGHGSLLKLSQNHLCGLKARRCQSHSQILKTVTTKLTFIPINTPPISLQLGQKDLLVALVLCLGLR